MSITTNLKRISLVAIATLGFGLLNAVPAQATLAGITLTVANGTGTADDNYDSSTAATVTVTATSDALTDSLTVGYVLKSGPAADASQQGRLRFIDCTTAAVANSTIIETLGAATLAQVGTTPGGSVAALDSISAANTNMSNTYRLAAGAANKPIGANFRLELDSSTSIAAGTYTFTVYVKAATVDATIKYPVSTTSADVSIVVPVLAANSTTPTSTYSFSRIGPSPVAVGGSDATDSALSVLATPGTTRGTVFVAVRNSGNGSSVAKDSLTATVTGVGLICNSDSSSCGKSLKVAATGDYNFPLQGDGFGGLSTITITSSVTGLVYSHTANYYTSAAKTFATPSVGTPLLRIGTNTDAVRVLATDTNGANWTGTAYIYALSAADAAIAGSQTPVACTYDATTDFRHECDITGATVGTAKFKIIDAATVALATATSAEISVTVGSGNPDKISLSFDKASYAPGERVRIYVNVLDSNGKALPEATHTNLLATGGISSNAALTFVGTGGYGSADSLTAVTHTTSKNASSTTGARAGSAVITAYMPTVGGTVTITAKGGALLPTANQVTVTASATVVDNAASAAASALAAVSALATQVASLKTLVTTLTNLILKIQKKVKA